MSQDQPPAPEAVNPEPAETPPESTPEASFDDVGRSTETSLIEAEGESAPTAAAVDPTQTEAKLPSAAAVSATEAGLIEAEGESTPTVAAVGSTQTEAKPPIDVAVSARSTPTRRPSPVNDEILPQTLLRLMGEAVVAAQPPLKKQSIKALRGTIHLLEKAVEQLEAAPPPKQARRRVPAPETAVENVLPPSSRTRTDKPAPNLSTGALGDKFRTIGHQVWRAWRPLLRQLRDRLPASINRNFSDRALTGAIGGLLIMLLWIASSLLPAKPQPTTIAKVPPSERVVPSPTPSPTPTPIPPLVKAPEAPKPVDSSPTPVKPSLPPPPLKFPPEQTLIARIQNQVAAISNQYASGLIQSVQANFRGSRLIVNVSDRWYSLSRSQQDSLAGEILRRTENLDFIKLELVDGTGALLARSPIVGAEMIILKRTKESTEAV